MSNTLEYSRRYREKNRERLREYNRNFHQKRKSQKSLGYEKTLATMKKNNAKRSPQGRLDDYLRAKYSISLETFSTLNEVQNGLCAICQKEQKPRLAVDHDHVTGKVRGLLCNNCNWMLGSGKDNSTILKKGAEYLERHS